jgi:membrane protein YdbS with pleckstrin-like domain
MTEEPTVLFTAEPSLKPTVAGILTAVVVAVAVVGGLYASGLGEDATDTASLVVGILALLAVLRLAARLYVLTRTTYTVTETEIRREYAFLLRRSERSVPVRKLRGVQLSRTPFQTVFGYGTVEFLTAGPNGSLGTVTFDDVSAPDERLETVRGLIRADDG